MSCEDSAPQSLQVTVGNRVIHLGRKTVALDTSQAKRKAHSISISIRHVVASLCRAKALSAASRLMSYRSENGIIEPS